MGGVFQYLCWVCTNGFNIVLRVDVCLSNVIVDVLYCHVWFNMLCLLRLLLSTQLLTFDNVQFGIHYITECLMWSHVVNLKHIGFVNNRYVAHKNTINWRLHVNVWNNDLNNYQKIIWLSHRFAYTYKTNALQCWKCMMCSLMPFNCTTIKLSQNCQSTVLHHYELGHM